MKAVFSGILLASLLVCLRVSAQQESIPFFTGGGIVGYSINGAGYAFSPNVSIAITALGFGGSDLLSNPYQVTLYDSTGAQLATAGITTNSTFYNQTYYQSISSVDLTAGDTYYIAAAEIGGSPENLWAGNIVGPSAGGSFSVNSDITYLNAGEDFFSGLPTTSLSDNFFVDENFQFTVVPEPPVLGLGLTAILGIIFHRYRGRLLRSS